MKVIGLTACISLCLIPITALAAAPRLSGVYALSLTENCQVTLTTHTDPNTGDVDSLETVDDGKLSETVASAKFNAAAGTITLSGAQGKGSILLVPGLSDPSEVMAQLATSESLSFSNTGSTLTINGDTFTAAYGDIAAGVAHYVTFMRVDTMKGCVEHGTAVHQ